MTDLQALHQALSEAECGSQELDGAIWEAVTGEPVKTNIFTADPHSVPLYVDIDGASTALPEISTSLDAITSLIERVLPGWDHQHDTRFKRAGVTRRHIPGVRSATGYYGEAPTVALALCLALVSALIAQEGEK